MINVKRLLIIAALQIAAVLSVQVPVYGYFTLVKTNAEYVDWTRDVLRSQVTQVSDTVSMLMNVLTHNMFNGANFVDRETGNTFLHIIFTYASPQVLAGFIDQLEIHQTCFFKKRHLRKKNKRGLIPSDLPRRSDDIEALKQRFAGMVMLKDVSSWCW